MIKENATFVNIFSLQKEYYLTKEAENIRYNHFGSIFLLYHSFAFIIIPAIILMLNM